MTTPVSSPPGPSPSPDPAPVADAGTRDFPARRLALMALIISTLLLTVNAFVCATLSHFFELPGWAIWQALPGIFPLAFLAATIAGFRYANAALRFIYAVSAAWLGALNFAFFAAAACWLLAVPDRLAGEPVPPSALAGTVFGLALLITLYGLINAAWLRVTRVEIRLPHLPLAWRGRTVALVTDIHLGRLV